MKPFSFSRLAFAATALSVAAAAAHAESATYAVDPMHTYATFEVKHFGTSTNRGRFDKSSGSVTFDAAAKTGQANITIETGSINTGSAPFDAHLKSKDFFDAATFPQATFASSKFVFDGDKLSEVQGTLTLLGKSQPVTLKANGFGCYENPRLKRQVCGGDFVTTFMRSSFGMTGLLPFVPDEVKMLIQIEAIKQ